MASGDFTTILTLGTVVVGGYFFITQIYPMMKRGIQDAFSDMDYDETPPPQRQVSPGPTMPTTIIEDRYPDYVVEDRYPDVILEDNYPDYYLPGGPIVIPSYYPIQCSAGKYWDGTKCRRVDCPPGMKWDDGRCRVDCPSGWRYDDGRCKPRSCDNDEYFDGRRCRDKPKPRPVPDWDWDDRDRGRKNSRDWKKNPRDVKKCPEGYFMSGGKCQKRSPDTERRFGSGNMTRDRWHEDRDREDKIKTATGINTRTDTPEKDRLQELSEKAIQSFLEVDYYY